MGYIAPAYHAYNNLISKHSLLLFLPLLQGDPAHVFANVAFCLTKKRGKRGSRKHDTRQLFLIVWEWSSLKRFRRQTGSYEWHTSLSNRMFPIYCHHFLTWILFKNYGINIPLFGHSVSMILFMFIIAFISFFIIEIIKSIVYVFCTKYPRYVYRFVIKLMLKGSISL